jgi:predicted lipid-binding transport protein (Tim44 family)
MEKMMKTWTYLIAVLTLGLSLGVGDAEAAKRLGGGKSVGMQKQTASPDKAPGATPAQAPNNATAATAAAPGAAAAAAPKRSWMGPLAGLAAGLGLAALASHFGFGEGLANMLLIGLAIMAVLAVVGIVMRKRAAAQQPGTAGPGGMQYAAAGLNPTDVQPKRFDVAMPGSTGGSQIGSQIGSALSSPSAIPADFDSAAFERNAKVQFIRLQAANDACNLDDLREFTTPEMFAELRMDITDRGAVTSKTEVVQVDASVLEVQEEANRYVVSVRFNGTVQESGTPQPEAFDEVWHLVKARTGAGGWLVAGITQRQ